MGKDRNKYFFDNRILLFKYPESDVPTETYDWGWHYEDGTDQFYALFQWDYNITTKKSFVWHLRVIKYINFKLNMKEFTDKKLIDTFYHICDVKNKFITFEMSQVEIEQLLVGILNYDFNVPPINNRRKVIFKPFLGISRLDKLRIVGSISGKKSSILDSDIYDIALSINSDGARIKMKDIAEALGCSDRTLRRNISTELKDEIIRLNGLL